MTHSLNVVVSRFSVSRYCTFENRDLRLLDLKKFVKMNLLLFEVHNKNSISFWPKTMKFLCGNSFFKGICLEEDVLAVLIAQILKRKIRRVWQIIINIEHKRGLSLKFDPTSNKCVEPREVTLCSF